MVVFSLKFRKVSKASQYYSKFGISCTYYIHSKTAIKKNGFCFSVVKI